MRKVALPPDSPRGGVLTQGTVLAVNVESDSHFAVKRGYLCSMPFSVRRPRHPAEYSRARDAAPRNNYAH